MTALDARTSVLYAAPMPSTRFLRRVVLDRTTRALLARLLEPHAEFFAARGLSLSVLSATLQDDRSLVREVFRILHVDVTAVPRALVDRLALFEGLANDSSQRSLYQLCPSLALGHTGCEDTAALAILDHPDAIAQARRGADAGAGPSFADFEAVSDRAPRLTAEALAALVADLRVWLVAHGRRALCDIHVTELEDETHIEIEHGRPPVTDDIVSEALDLTQLTLVRAERAVVIFDRASCCLSVHASHAAIKELLRRLVGAHLFGDDAHFRRAGAYSLEPMSSGLDASLAYDDVPGMKGVTLLGIVVNAGDERVTRTPVGKGDLRRVRRAREIYDVLADGGVVEWFKVRLEIEGHPRAIVLELSALKKKHARVPAEAERVVDAWLTARGYIVVTPQRRARYSDVSALAPSQEAEPAAKSIEGRGLRESWSLMNNP